MYVLYSVDLYHFSDCHNTTSDILQLIEGCQCLIEVEVEVTLI